MSDYDWLSLIKDCILGFVGILALLEWKRKVVFETKRKLVSLLYELNNEVNNTRISTWFTEHKKKISGKWTYEDQLGYEKSYDEGRGRILDIQSRITAVSFDMLYVDKKSARKIIPIVDLLFVRASNVLFIGRGDFVTVEQTGKRGEKWRDDREKILDVFRDGNEFGVEFKGLIKKIESIIW